MASARLPGQQERIEQHGTHARDEHSRRVGQVDVRHEQDGKRHQWEQATHGPLVYAEIGPMAESSESPHV